MFQIFCIHSGLEHRPAIGCAVLQRETRSEPHSQTKESQAHGSEETTNWFVSVNHWSVSSKEGHGCILLKSGRLYIPGTSGKKGVSMKDTKGKTQIQKEERLEKNQCRGLQQSRRTMEDAGRPLRVTLLRSELSSKEDSPWRRWGRAYLEGTPVRCDMSLLMMLTTLCRFLFLEQQHSLMLYAERGLQCMLIKTK